MYNVGVGLSIRGPTSDTIRCRKDVRLASACRADVKEQWVGRRIIRYHNVASDSRSDMIESDLSIGAWQV